MNHSPRSSYEKHSNNELRFSQTGSLPSMISKPHSIDAWRHTRMLEPVLPLVKSFPKSTWMTVGDGCYGSDAFFLQKNGANVLATSLNSTSLEIAKERGYIEKFKSENAEKISFSDDSFDFILCKEAYHHFPRPAIGFYEMLRVCKKGVVLIEPHETSKRFLNFLKAAFKKYVRKDLSLLFEDSGNFIYRVNVNEIKKMMTALNYHVIAVRKYNDFYHPRLAANKYLPWSLSTILTKTGIAVQNALSSLGLLEFGLVCVVAFKEKPIDDLVTNLKQNGFQIITLPTNPYL